MGPYLFFHYLSNLGRWIGCGRLWLDLRDRRILILWIFDTRAKDITYLWTLRGWSRNHYTQVYCPFQEASWTLEQSRWHSYVEHHCVTHTDFPECQFVHLFLQDLLPCASESMLHSSIWIKVFCTPLSCFYPVALCRLISTI